MSDKELTVEKIAAIEGRWRGRDLNDASWADVRSLLDTLKHLREGLQIAVNSCRDVTTLGRFAPAVDPIRWIMQLQAHLEDIDLKQ